MKKLYILAALLAATLPAALDAANKVVVVPLNSSTKATDGRVWGEGRDSTGVMTMQPPAGYCQMPSGIKYALSTHLSDWNSSSSVCPADNWVCRESDIQGQTPCSPPFGPKDTQINCTGTIVSSDDPVWLTGWLADTGTQASEGRRMTTDSINGTAGDDDICISYFVWCCWR